eukprot:TRINITY_DN4153_c0_g1_i1.p1 TRINITY_DN4153_c0_g1~~TRINITY_DN4153_c0_g1_i1.p1  ORF type:complete len:217 (-),score=49.30 TRINITY_DN4153_c0_g1_i1:69-719(-)
MIRNASECLSFVQIRNVEIMRVFVLAIFLLMFTSSVSAFAPLITLASMVVTHVVHTYMNSDQAQASVMVVQQQLEFTVEEVVTSLPGVDAIEEPVAVSVSNNSMQEENVVGSRVNLTQKVRSKKSHCIPTPLLMAVMVALKILKIKRMQKRRHVQRVRAMWRNTVDKINADMKFSLELLERADLHEDAESIKQQFLELRSRAIQDAKKDGVSIRVL